MRNKKRFLSWLFSPALFLLIVSVMPSCKSDEIECPVYFVERNCNYQDLIRELADKGRIEISAMASESEGSETRKAKWIVFSKEIRPVDMIGAEKFVARNRDLLMSSPGEISHEFFLPAGNNRVVVEARGAEFEGEPPRMIVGVDSMALGEMDTRSEWDTYVFPMKLERGKHRIHISLLNGEQHRKLIITNVRVDRAIYNDSEFVQTYMAKRFLDDSLNGFNELPLVIMGKMNSVSRRSLLLPAPSRAEIRVAIPENATLQFAAGIDEYVWSERSSACEFLLLFEEGKKEHVLFRKKFRPFEDKRQKRWLEVNIDLSEFKNKKGLLKFKTIPLASQEDAGHSHLGYFLLANPRIVFPTRADDPNIVLISIDTLRRDHLSTYGYRKKTSPFLDTLAGESAVFNNAIAQAPYTVTSHITMMTSLWPSTHQILTHDYQDRLLPQVLKAWGYQTAGFTGGGQVSAVYGFDRGMDVYDFEGGRSEVIFPKATEWIAKTLGNPFFLFLHTYDVHMPYEPPPPYDSLFDPAYDGVVGRWTEGCVVIDESALFNRILDLYDGEIRYVDAQIQRVVQFLREKGLYENTMLIITSDHGEEFMEHGTMACHAHTLYNELLLIPLIIKFPKGQWAGRTILDPVALNDLMPTVLGSIDIPVPSHSQGESLLDYLEGKVKRDRQRPIFSEQVVIRDDPRIEVSIQTLSEKYYQKLDLPGEYYDLISDPAEKHSLAEIQKKRVSGLVKTIREYISANTKLAKLGSETQGGRSQEIDKRTVEKLKALGYIK
jgi:arylsulfatase A-like enzyme